MSGVSLPALARALSAELARVAGLLTVALVAITASRPQVIPLLPAQELLHARRCVVNLLRQIGSSYLGQEPTWSAELTRPAFPLSSARDGGPVHPWQAGDLIEACPEILGLVALPWSDAWARWAGEIELLLDPVWQAAMLAPMAAPRDPSLEPRLAALPSLRRLREASRPTEEELAARPARAAAGGVKPGPGLTQGELAARTKRHVRNMISQWERGVEVPSLEARATLLRALGVTATLEQIQVWTIAPKSGT